MTVKVGSQGYPLIEHDGSLFADEERAFLFQMLDNNTAVVAGEQTSVTYSLAGFTKAHSDYCLWPKCGLNRHSVDCHQGLLRSVRCS